VNTVRSSRTQGGLGVIVIALLLSGCAGGRDVMSAHVPAHCNGAATPFRTFAIRQDGMPGFIEPVVRQALLGSLAREGLEEAPEGVAPDVTLVARFALVDLDPEGTPGEPGQDAFGDRVVPGAVTRFTAHVDLEMLDNRDGALVWRGSMNRPHAILGGETFHDERAVLIVSNTLDDMLRGIREPCAR
jgi:hypothetical protein